MNRLTALLFLVCLLAPTLGGAADLEGRVTRLENILANQRSSDLLLQIQRLQQEVQQLRGQIERQTYEIDTLKKQQREHYMDLDARLRGKSGGAAPAAEAPPAGGRRGMEASLPPATPSGAPGAAAQAGGSRKPDLSLPSAETARSQSEQEAYRNAFDLLKQRRYDDAVRAFEDLLTVYPKGEFADNARYWLGETNYVKRDYAAALNDFQRVVSDYPLSPKVPGAMLKIGYIQDEQKDWQNARNTLQDVTRKFPDTTEARLAQSRLERMAREGH